MTTYKYEAISASGVPITGVIQAQDRSDAVIKLKETCTIVNKLTEVSDEPDILKKAKSQKINEKNLSLVCKQFAIILTAGLPIVRTCELVAGQTEDKVLRKILTDVAGDVQGGYGLANSFQLHGPKLPNTFIETIRAGEESGNLEAAFERLSNFYAKKSKIRSKVISALTYPAFVMVVAVIVIIVIMVFAVPTFASTFASMGMDLPLPTRILIGMSDFFTKYGLILLLLIVAAAVAIHIYGKTELGGEKLGEIKLRIPILGKVQLMNAASQFANTFSTMLASGLPVVRALTITAGTMSNRYLSRSVKNSIAGVESGFTVGDCLRKEHKLPDLLIEMTGVGEQSGSLEETLSVVGEYYDNEVETTTNRAIGLLEPIIICVLAVFVVLVLLAVYLPMFSMYDTIG